MTSRYIMQYSTGNADAGNTGAVVLTASSGKGLTIVSTELTLTGLGSGVLIISQVDSVAGGYATQAFPIVAGSPAALATVVFAPTSWGSVSGVYGGEWGLTGPTAAPVNFTPYPLTIAPSASLMFQVTGGYAAYFNVFFDE
jgi:hypothetical protein